MLKKHKMGGLDYFVERAYIEEAVKIHHNIPEFEGYPLLQMYNEKTSYEIDSIVFVAYKYTIPAGYIISYDRYEDHSLYVWMAAVNPEFRRQAIFKDLMEETIKWAKLRGYDKIKLKTRNARREMLNYLVKNGYNFTQIDKDDNILENRIHAEKSI